MALPTPSAVLTLSVVLPPGEVFLSDAAKGKVTLSAAVGKKVLPPCLRSYASATCCLVRQGRMVAMRCLVLRGRMVLRKR